jgi:DNA-binding NarL/FixJ family response regulator
VKKILVLLADDHVIVRQGLCTLLEGEDSFEVVGQARNGREAVKMAQTLRPDVILMDIAMPVLNGLEATRQILAANPAAKVLILSAHQDVEYVECTAAVGAVGFVEKRTAYKVLTKAIRETAKGNLYFRPAIARRIARRDRKALSRTTQVKLVT